MVNEEHLARVRIAERPLGQRLVAQALRIDYMVPSKTNISIVGLDNIPDCGVMFALNHTDRYNYWPFQYELYRIGHPRMTMAWVKAKYYENKMLGWFFDQCNNLPLPSMGYLILKDAIASLGRKLSDDEYRTLRDLVDFKMEPEEVSDTIAASLKPIFENHRSDFNPDVEHYRDFLNRWNDRLMGLVERRTLEAVFEKQNHIIVFPQGTRSLRLLPAKTGMLEFAFRHNIPIVPVGSNGCEHVYPGGSPFSSGGAVEYRIGKALTLDGAFSECRIDEDYAPFTRDSKRFKDKFQIGADILTRAINELLDEPYQLGDANDDRTRADRFM